MDAEAEGCYCYWTLLTQVVVHVFINHVHTCTCGERHLRH